MEIKKQIRALLEAKPLPIPIALSLVNRLAPNKIDLYRFHALPVAQKRTRLKNALKELENKPMSEMPVVQISKAVAPKKKSITELLSMETKLNFDQLPDSLKLLVIRRYDCKRLAVAAHATMHEAEDKESRLAASLQCTDLMAENWKIWNELMHYSRTGLVLGKHEQFKIDKFEKEIAEIERNNSGLIAAKLLLSKLNTARTVMYRHRKADNQVLLKKWIERYNMLATKLNEPLWQER